MLEKLTENDKEALLADLSKVLDKLAQLADPKNPDYNQILKARLVRIRGEVSLARSLIIHN